MLHVNDRVIAVEGQPLAGRTLGTMLKDLKPMESVEVRITLD